MTKNTIVILGVIWLTVIWLAIIGLTVIMLLGPTAKADNAINNIPESLPPVEMQLVSEDAFEVCYKIEGEPEIYCFIKE